MQRAVIFLSGPGFFSVRPFEGMALLVNNNQIEWWNVNILPGNASLNGKKYLALPRRMHSVLDLLKNALLPGIPSIFLTLRFWTLSFLRGKNLGSK
ncbi:MAG: hypothetical protein GY820_11565 [Gammaproteobacteria bacterium]|nr:hypothetical protein [Gammaproteobacteria bacterium]